MYLKDLGFERREEREIPRNEDVKRKSRQGHRQDIKGLTREDVCESTVTRLPVTEEMLLGRVHL